MHKFVILRNGKLEEYTRYEDIPKEFDNVIEFNPSVPPGPHTEEQHDEMAAWDYRLKELMKRELK